MSIEFQVIEERPGEVRFPTPPGKIKLQPGLVKEHPPSAGDFGKAETEAAAGKLIAFFQARGWWVSFGIGELVSFYTERGWEIDDMFFGLIGTWYDDSSHEFRQPEEIFIVLGNDRRYRVTNQFITLCFQGNRK
jgi:hypothetical protein